MKNQVITILLLTTILVFTTFRALAVENKALQFSDLERTQHLKSLKTLTQSASQCLLQTQDYQNAFFQKNGFSPFYGDSAKSFIAMSDQNRISYLAEQTQQSESRVANAIQSIRGATTGGADSKMKNMSCVGLVMRCLGFGFKKAGQENLWAKVRGFVAEHDYDGTFLQAALQGLGWKVYYWNPNLLMNQSWDQSEEQAGLSNALRGYHASRYRQIQKTGVYYYTRVDDSTSLVNFKTKTPDALKAADFFVGTAHSGYHVFSGYQGYVIEGHAGRGPLAADIVESGYFNPLTKEGKPSSQSYRSGLIAVPPVI